MVFEKLRTYPIVIAVAPGHSFARRRSVTLDVVLAEPIVAYSRKEYPDYHELLARVIGPAAKRLCFAEECDSGMSLIAAVESGTGIAITSSSLAGTAGQRLKFMPLIPAPSPAVVGIACRKDGWTPLVRTLVETARLFATTKD